MSTARDFILDAYSQTLKSLFDKLYVAYAGAADDVQRRQAEERFSAGVSLAVAVRDRAIALLSPQA